MNFRISLDQTSTRSLEVILASDLQGPAYDRYEPRIPIAELDDTLSATYFNMSEENDKPDEGYIPGLRRGLQEGDWMIIREYPFEGYPERMLYCLVAPWRYKGMLEKYVHAISWEEHQENAVYLFKEEYLTNVPTK